MWALGVLTYEMILGAPPFYDDNKSIMFSNVVNSLPFFPPGLDRRISDFIERLLSKNPDERPLFDDLRDDPFFEGFNWDKIAARAYRPSFIPVVGDLLNPVNFDPEFTSETTAESTGQEVSGDVTHVPGFSYFDSSIASA